MKHRFILDTILFLAIMQGWWFVAIPVALIGMLRFEWYFEVLIAGIAYDSLFGLVPGHGVLSYIGILFSLGMFLIMILLKKVMRK